MIYHLLFCLLFLIELSQTKKDQLHGIIEVPLHDLGEKCPWFPDCFDEDLRCPFDAVDGQCAGLSTEAGTGKRILNPYVALDTLVLCRRTCRMYEQHMEHMYLDQMKVLATSFGGTLDYILDPFGYPHSLCDLSKGMIASSRRAMLHIHYESVSYFDNERWVPKYTETGVKLSKVPERAWRAIKAWHEETNKNGTWKKEECRVGVTNCETVTESDSECSLPQDVTTQQINLFSIPAQIIIGKALKDEADEWAGIRLRLNNVYGIRRYTRGAYLLSHVDKVDTHVISAIINVAQKVDSPWPLNIKDHQGKNLKVYLKPGDMLWYESARLPHGRVEPFNGDYFDNVFVHFKPLDKIEL